MRVGIDLGSRNVKIVTLTEQGLGEMKQIDTISFYRNYGRKEDEKLIIDFNALGLKGFDRLVSTGYGRLTINIQGAKNIPELKAHMLGAIYQTGLEDFTLVDLGGQDTKVIKIRRGKMVDFLTNDRCAASSGRYLENMAQVLGVDVTELGKHYKNPVELNSTCAVFGESELIGKIIEGHPHEHLAAGVNNTIYKRVEPMLRNMMSETLVFTGGVAFSEALVKMLELGTGKEVIVPKHPQYNGAIGCCIEASKGVN
ncbi:putative CoA-substrate-specific enzyme activase [Desulfitispora alkaliphila]|uniref:acyl-CoA dehydratase activase n=1 Tax=Desulfitispora alkaliphila TaxID=622674 RepID=UPI003D20B97C